MSRICLVCTSKDRSRIEREMLRGVNLSDLARRYNTPYQSIYYHYQNHISRDMVARRSEDLAENLLGELETVLNEVKTIYATATDRGDGPLALKALAETRTCLELLAKVRFNERQLRELENENLKLRMASTEPDPEAEKLFSDSLQHLTFNETLLLGRINDKRLTGTNETIVADGNPDLTEMLSHPERFVNTA